MTAYVGFDPVEDSSGTRRRIGSISKQGSRLLRFLLVEAGQIAIRRDQELAQVYKRVCIRRGHAKAKVAVARRLLVRAFIMLRDEIDYAEFHRRGRRSSVFPANRIGCKCLGLDWETSLSRPVEKVRIDPHVAFMPEEMIERVIATRNVRDCNACKSGKTKTVVSKG